MESINSPTTVSAVQGFPPTLCTVAEPLEDPDADALITAFGMILEAGGALRSVLSHELEAACGIPASWFGVLLRVARAPGGRLRMSELASGVALTASGATRLVDRIESADLIRRVACPEDRRVAWTELTTKGRKVLRQALPVHLEGLRRHIGAHLSDDEVRLLTDLLRRLRDANLPPR